MNIFKRLLKIGQAEIHSLVEKMESPLTLIEQGIRDLKEELAKTEEQFVQVRAINIRMENKQKEKLAEATEYENKTKRILEKANANEIDIQKADSLAIEALSLKKTLIQEAEEFNQEIILNNSKIKEISNKLDVLKSNISKWEKELTTIKTKQKITDASMYANKQMATIENNSTIEMLERLKNKTADNESLAEAYAELSKKQLDDELNEILIEKDDIKNELDAIKQSIGNHNKK